MSIHPFGTLPDGEQVHEIRLANASGATASILTFGAALRDLVVPMADGTRRRAVLGYQDVDAYLKNNRFLGVTVGRYASRMGGGLLPIDGVVHQLSLNDGGLHHLHGGTLGFSRRTWSIIEDDESSVTLGLVSPDGEDGYPGRLDVRLTYRLVEPATLAITMSATTDAPTAVSLAHHSYFNLLPGSTSRQHRLKAALAGYVPFNEFLVPAGDVTPVAGTPYDFDDLRPIADPNGAADFDYDCCLVLTPRGDEAEWAARLEAPDGSLAMDIHTTEPCLVFYDGLGLTPEWPTLDGGLLSAHAGLCLEPMRYPDGPNQPNFPSSILRPGETYRQTTEYRFSST